MHKLPYTPTPPDRNENVFEGEAFAERSQALGISWRRVSGYGGLSEGLGLGVWGFRVQVRRFGGFRLQGFGLQVSA